MVRCSERECGGSKVKGDKGVRGVDTRREMGYTTCCLSSWRERVAGMEGLKRQRWARAEAQGGEEGEKDGRREVEGVRACVREDSGDRRLSCHTPGGALLEESCHGAV